MPPPKSFITASNSVLIYKHRKNSYLASVVLPCLFEQLVYNIRFAMAVTEPFELHAKEYDAWFDKHPAVYEIELSALMEAISENGVGMAVEIGAGTGRFAVPLAIEYGVEPSQPGNGENSARAWNAHHFRRRGKASSTPSNMYDTVLYMTTFCFIDDPMKALREAYRVLYPGGKIIIGFIDGRSQLGKLYHQKKEANSIYRHARFYSYPELRKKPVEAGFRNVKVWQTLFNSPEKMTEPEPVKEGFGAGGFLVIRAEKPALSH